MRARVAEPRPSIYRWPPSSALISRPAGQLVHLLDGPDEPRWFGVRQGLALLQPPHLPERLDLRLVELDGVVGHVFFELPRQLVELHGREQRGRLPRLGLADHTDPAG